MRAAPTTRAELQAASPAQPVRSLRDLPETDLVWTTHVEHEALAHQRARHLVAACGAPVLEWPVCADHLLVLGGRLCPACWTTETPAGSSPAGDQEGIV